MDIFVTLIKTCEKIKKIKRIKLKFIFRLSGSVIKKFKITSAFWLKLPKEKNGSPKRSVWNKPWHKKLRNTKSQTSSSVFLTVHSQNNWEREVNRSYKSTFLHENLKTLQIFASHLENMSLKFACGLETSFILLDQNVDRFSQSKIKELIKQKLLRYESTILRKKIDFWSWNWTSWEWTMNLPMIKLKSSFETIPDSDSTGSLDREQLTSCKEGIF